MNLDRDKLKKRFHELTAKAAAIRAKSDPVRAARDKLVAKHAKEEAAANKKVKDVEEGLFEIEQERAMIARAVGNVGEPE